VLADIVNPTTFTDWTLHTMNISQYYGMFLGSSFARPPHLLFCPWLHPGLLITVYGIKCPVQECLNTQYRLAKEEGPEIVLKFNSHRGFEVK
jgi:hypothetical protein